MAKDAEKVQGSPEETPKKKKSKKKLLIMIIGLVVILGGGAGGYFYFKSSGHEAEAAPPEPGIVVPLEAITINLADGHYLKVKFSLQATIEVHEELDGSKALDIAIDLFTNRTVEELSSNEERDRAKKELKEKVSEAYEHEVMDVYLTLFVIQ